MHIENIIHFLTKGQEENMKDLDIELIRLTIEATSSKEELYQILLENGFTKKLVDEYFKNNPKEKKKMLATFEKKEEKNHVYKIILDSSVIRIPEMLKTLKKLSKKGKFVLSNITIEKIKKKNEKEKVIKFFEFAAAEKKHFYYEKMVGSTEENAIENYCKKNSKCAILTSDSAKALKWRTEGIEVIYIKK